MILVDANILIYAHLAIAKQNEATRAWLDEQLTSGPRVGLPWGSLLAFLRVVTNPRIHTQPIPMAVALRQVSEWLDCGTVWIPQPTERHAELLSGLLAQTGIYGNLVSDAHLAALAIEHGLTLCSTDGDFARFPGLRYLNPLAA